VCVFFFWLLTRSSEPFDVNFLSPFVRIWVVVVGFGRLSKPGGSYARGAGATAWKYQVGTVEPS
jgi:hypothetical protein